MTYEWEACPDCRAAKAAGWVGVTGWFDGDDGQRHNHLRAGPGSLAPRQARAARRRETFLQQSDRVLAGIDAAIRQADELLIDETVRDLARAFGCESVEDYALKWHYGSVAAMRAAVAEAVKGP
jgi:hypothetical protein